MFSTAIPCVTTSARCRRASLAQDRHLIDVTTSNCTQTRGFSMATAAAPKVFKNYINGEWIPARSGKAIEDRNPANTGELVGMFPASSADDVNQAIDAAKRAFKDWRLTPAPKRAEILYRAAQILTETRGDVQEAIDMTYLMAGEGRRQFGQTTPSELPNKFAMCVRSPIGV